MYSRGPGSYLLSIGITLVIGAVAWFTVGRDILDGVNESNERSAGGGPQSERIVSPGRFEPIVDELRDRVGAGARLVSVTVRPLSVEFVTSQEGTVARGHRWRQNRRGLGGGFTEYEEAAGATRGAPWRLESLDPDAPQRITRAISKAEGGDFLLSIGDIQRADTGKLVWIMRGTIGERGVAYSAAADGSGVKRYDPTSPELSRATVLTQCISQAAGDPAKIQRCVARYGRQRPPGTG